MRKKMVKHIVKAPPPPPPTLLWTCQPQGPVAELTVGERFTINCTGATDGIHTERLELKDKDLSSEIPSLSLLENKTEGTNLKFVVTSYRVGAHKTDEVALWDGAKKINISGFEWTVKSILKQDPANPPQAFPAFPMFRMGYPTWFWILLALGIAVLIGGPYWQFNRFKKRKKQFDDLKNLDSVLNPLDAFFKDIRKIEKTLDKEDFNAQHFLLDIRKNLNIFLSRSFRLPIHLWGPFQSSREIKKKYPKVFRDHGQELNKFFSELARTNKQLTKKDCIFLQEQAQKLVEHVDASLERHNGGKK